ncbi:toxin [Streptomyces sp. NPDC088747]|uniref:toxin n=1 Tax=Streptomyces sp. NPDC088747 TaxID=3365886 RepID=UPI003808E25F
MATRSAMKSLLATLSEDVSSLVDQPAKPVDLMEAFCRAMSGTCGRRIRLVFQIFPPDAPISGLRLEFADGNEIIVVEERAVDEAKLVIIGHELWHVYQRDSHCEHASGLQAAARGLTDHDRLDTLQRAVDHVLKATGLPREGVRATAARSDSADIREEDAETFGLLFGQRARELMVGPYAQGPTSSATREGRINLSLLGNRGGRIR